MSACRQSSPPLAGARRSDLAQVVLATPVIDELREVMARKFLTRHEALEVFLVQMSYEMALTPATVDPGLYPHVRDPRDYSILASAIIADVDVLVPGSMIRSADASAVPEGCL